MDAFAAIKLACLSTKFGVYLPLMEHAIWTVVDDVQNDPGVMVQTPEKGEVDVGYRQRDRFS